MFHSSSYLHSLSFLVRNATEYYKMSERIQSLWKASNWKRTASQHNVFLCLIIRIDLLLFFSRTLLIRTSFTISLFRSIIIISTCFCLLCSQAISISSLCNISASISASAKKQISERSRKRSLFRIFLCKNWSSWLISSTFWEQLLQTQIPKTQKR